MSILGFKLLKAILKEKHRPMAKKNCFILVNKNGNMITTDHKLPIYWNKSVALNDKEKFGADKLISVRIDYLKNLLKQSATSEYLKNNAKKINNQNKKKYYYEIYYDRGGNDIRMQMLNHIHIKRQKDCYWI